jgi:uncharacterized protein (DUF58 family)
MVVVGATVSIIAGRLFGIFELFVAGAAGASVVMVCVVAVGLTRLRLDVARELHPPRVHAGTPSRVELEVANRGGRRTPLLQLRDPVGPGRAATVVLAPMRRGEVVRASYRLPTDQRGILRIGPLQVQVGDPFGLTSVATPAAPVTELTVWPAVDAVSPLPHTTGDDPHGGTDIPSALANVGDDFHALRPYVTGDDLRRVHWPSTARNDELLVRQDEMPWESRATVALDTRRTAHSSETFERAVSAAASIVAACSRRHFLLRLVTTAGEDTGFGSGAAHVDAIMEQLALVRTSSTGDLPSMHARLRGAGSGGALAVLLGEPDAGSIESVARLRRAYGHLTTVGFTAGAGAGVVPPGATDIVLVTASGDFAPAWNLALSAGRRSGGRAARAGR